MKLAVIPPVGWEQYIKHGDIGMALAQVTDERYQAAFSKYAAEDGYVILDNGAAEHAYLPGRDLHRAATAVSAQEIVLPDIMGDVRATKQAVHEFLRNRYTRFNPASTDYFYMGVVQGNTLDELKSCIDWYSKREEVTVLGIPRHIITTVGPHDIRIQLANWIKEREIPMPIHMLGTHRNVPTEVKWLGRYAPHVRSIDTSAPFVYSLHGYTINGGTKAIDRPSWYLEGTKSPPEETRENRVHALTMFNIGVLKRWASGA